MMEPRELDLSPREALQWIGAIAAEPADGTPQRPGTGTQRAPGVRSRARGRPVPRNAVDDVGFALAMAEQAARMFGVQGLEVVKMGAMALDRLARRRARRPRNLSLRIGGHRIAPDLGTLGALEPRRRATWLRVGAAALQAKLVELGITRPSSPRSSTS